MQKKLCTRKLDELGRISLPKEARNTLGIKEKQSLDVFIDDDSIIIKTNNIIPICTLCGEADLQLKEIGHFLICSDCITKIKNF